MFLNFQRFQHQCVAIGITKIAIIGLFALAVSIGAIQETRAQTKGGEIVVGIETDVRGFDAVKGGVLGQQGEIVWRTMSEPLLDYDPDTNTYSPLLALSWEASEDQKIWTFKLRPRVKFHDGTEFTAEDVAHHYNRILDPKNKSRSRTFISAIDKVVAVDSLTAEFHLKHPWQALLPFVATTSMSGPIPSRANVDAEKQNREPVGTGPFKFVSWSSGDRIIVERNPDYWAADEIHLDRILFRVLPDTQTRFASLKSGEVDVIWTDRGATIVEAEQDPKLVTLQKGGAGGAITIMNSRNTHLDDIRIRKAIAHAWNQNAVIQISWQGTKPFAKHALGPNSECGDASYLEYDPEAAKALVADYGKPVKLTMIHTTTPRGRELGEIMQQMLKQVGIELELIPMDQGTLVKRVFTREYDISGWRIMDGADVGPQLFALVHSESSYNLTGWSTPEVDELALAMRTSPDQDERMDKQCELSAEINASGTMLFRGGGKYYAFTSKRVKNVPDPYRGAIDVTRAWVE